jgi:hypothetical protein
MIGLLKPGGWIQLVESTTRLSKAQQWATCFGSSVMFSR